MSLPVNVVDRKTEGRVSAIAPKRRTSMLPKPEISPKPSHLTSMSPVRFQTNGYDSPAANKSPTYQFNSINNINMNGKQMSTSLQCQNLKKRSFEFDAHHKRESGSNETSTKSTGTSPPYALGISASCTTISTIDQATRAQGTLNGDNTNHEKPATKDSKLVDKTKGTASMLKSTLKRMSRLSLRSTGGSSPRSLSPFVFKKSTSPTQTNSANDNQQHSSNIPVSNNGTNRRSITSNGNDTAGKGKQANNFYSLNRQNSRKRSGIGTAHLSSAIVSDSYGKPAANNNSSGLQNTQPGASSYCRSLSRSTSNSSSSSNINNIGGQSNGNAHRSNSLKRPSRNKDLAVNQKVSNGTNTLQRSGSSSGTSSTSARDVKRSNSMHHHSQRRTFRDRDLNVKYSRGVQTQLTKDAASMDDDNDDASNVNEGGQFPTNIEFSVYFPDLLGSTGCDDVETHVSESTEPVDVRRNRQLQLDNMKLHREIEKYKSAANESDNLKRELRQVRSRLEEEQRSRARIEHELDQHNDKVKLIARSMDSVEQEFEFRDASIQQLETEMRNTKDKATSLEEKLKNANEIITKQNAELSDALSGQQAVLKEYEVAEAEAAELHEFLQSEKITLNEALKESEQEVEDLKNKINSAEERCGQVVRLSEQRNQEILALEAQLEGVEDRAKEMLLSQDSEISQSVTQIAELGSKIEEYLILLYPTKYNSEYSVSNEINTTKDIDCIAPGGNVTFAPKDISSNDDILINGIKSTSDCTNPLPYESNMKDNKLNETVNTMNGINGDVSLQNLSNAIKHRKKISENNSSPGSCSHRSKSSLLSTISKVNNLVKKLFEIGSTEVDKR
jgi:predicted  nucleic acid-binding Zn-ribbon protein